MPEPVREDAGDDSIARVLASWHESRPDLDTDPIAITARLARLQSHLGARVESVFMQYGLTGANFAVLATIVRLGGTPCSQKTLMSELNLTAGTISVRIDRLVTDGLVRRRPHPTDGRGWLVGLTARGRRRFEDCAPVHLANARSLTTSLDDAERETLALLLGKLLRSLE